MPETDRSMPLHIDIVSDVVCPWCVVGYLQLQKALATMPGVFEVTVRWQPFELNPQMPPEGQELREHLRQKYGSTPQQGSAARQRLVEFGQALGFHFDYYDGMRMVNTFRAHQLLHWAEGFGLQTTLKMALFEAFFSQRQDVNDPAVLVRCAQDVGLDAVEASAVLGDGRYEDDVRRAQRHWQEREVYAVPAFFLQERYQVPGAQESPTWIRLLNKIHQRESHAASGS
ncbi:MAG: DsbA family oxidoreductase [Gammaproteobacteria bacterium]|nr:DsbA family oxidoreductase [Gammaproteobacteria bacterium]